MDLFSTRFEHFQRFEYSQRFTQCNFTHISFVFLSKKSQEIELIKFFLQLHIPPYASSIYIELYERETGYFVQFYYRNTDAEKLPPLEIPGCGVSCPLDRLYELYADVLPTEEEDHETLCRL